MLISIAMDAFRGGQQEVGFKDVATGRGVSNLCSSGSSVLADSAGKISTKEIGTNLCDEASAAIQEQMFYATSIPIN